MGIYMSIYIYMCCTSIVTNLLYWKKKIKRCFDQQTWGTTSQCSWANEKTERTNLTYQRKKSSQWFISVVWQVSQQVSKTQMGRTYQTLTAKLLALFWTNAIGSQRLSLHDMGFTAGVFTPPSGELDHRETVQILSYRRTPLRTAGLCLG